MIKRFSVEIGAGVLVGPDTRGRMYLTLHPDPNKPGSTFLRPTTPDDGPTVLASIRTHGPRSAAELVLLRKAGQR